MSHMYRLNHDGTVERCDDTPDVTCSGHKYAPSTMREGQWIFINEYHGRRTYIDESEVPNVIKLAVMIGG